MSAVAARLRDGRLHLQHGPIDLIIEAFGAADEVECAYVQAVDRFGDILPTLVGELPTGGGVLVLGVDDVDIGSNEIQNNNFFGIAMIDYCIAVDGTANSCENNPPFYADTSPDDNRFIDNVVTGNGSDPPPGPFQAVAGDILGLGGSNNCASGNRADITLLSPELPAC